MKNLFFNIMYSVFVGGVYPHTSAICNWGETLLQKSTNIKDPVWVFFYFESI